jgi:hypothetical protein
MASLPVTGAAGSSTSTLTLSSPDAFLASVPHMLGFACDDSVVLVGLGPDAGGLSSLVRLTQRFDTPSASLTAVEVADLARSAAEPMSRAGSTEVIVAVFGSTRPVPGVELPLTPLVDRLIESLDDAGMGVRDALYTDGISRWSYGCENPSCCPPEGRVIPDEVRTHVAAEFAITGAAMAPSRAALVAELAPADPQALAQVAGLVVARAAQVPGARSGRRLEAWRDAAIADVDRITSGESPTPEAAASALVGLRDIRVRDTALWDLGRAPGPMPAAADGLAALVRSAPEGDVAPAATALAIVHWLDGDGARANVALDRALADNHDYSLGLMVSTALRSGLPPQSWSDAMSGLSRDTCRYGADRPVAAPAPATPPAPRITSSPGLAG